ncbi:hypothetical protein MAR_006356 [Mya arenaria]|uniref:Uncharacterized protein n=1 Tax=Mya arenaria TaxID=6604 RepID=A0ABY7DAZ3_MYAAR|nr:hypothetical protein MAR_006356 [Mya arenaria]
MFKVNCISILAAVVMVQILIRQAEKKECQDIMKIGDVCYCEGDECNGQLPVATSGWLLPVTLAALVVVVFNGRRN